MKKCPYCAEIIQDEAIKCRFCAEALNKDVFKNHKEKPLLPRRFKSTALKEGKKCQGVFTAYDLEDAKKKLKEQGYEVLSLREVLSIALCKEKFSFVFSKIPGLVAFVIVLLIVSFVFIVGSRHTSVEKSTLSKTQTILSPLYSFDQPLKEYTIASKRTIHYKIIEGDLSVYSAREIQSWPFILKKELNVLVSGPSKQDIEIVFKDIINKELTENSDTDEIVALFYTDIKHIKDHKNIATGTWAVEGGLGAISPALEQTNDKSQHKINMAYDEAAFTVAKPEPVAVSYQPGARLNPAQLGIVKYYLSALREHPELTEQIISLKISEAYGITVADLKAMHREYMDGDYE